MSYKYIVVGSGFAGSVIAERIANLKNQKVLVIEKRNHIGGNCFDYKNEKGIIIHKYGPHLFHTNYKDVFKYISNFSDFSVYHHRVRGYIDGKKVPIPFNFESINMCFPSLIANKLIEKLLNFFKFGESVPILDLLKIDDKEVRFLANFVYEKVFLKYTSKQWGKQPEEIDKEVTARVPVRISNDDRYFQDFYQIIPTEGYTKIFERMLFGNSYISVLLNTNFKDIIKLDYERKKIFFLGKEFKGKLIFTGMLDELFDYKFGVLPYRSLNFDILTLERDYYQEVATVNYPNDYDFTRITEFKHIHPVDSRFTTIMFEYPKHYKIGDIPYYPMFDKNSEELYSKYYELASSFDNLVLVGRLAEYKYFDMDDVIKRALEIFEEKVQ